MENRTDQRVFWHGKLKKESRKTWQATALTALCSVALFCLLFSYKKMYPFGDGSVAITDLYSQYLPLLYHFYDVVTGQKNLFLDFSVSGGANLYADTINEVLNPFNYVLLLFGRDRIYQAVNVLVLLYSTASAVTAHIFLEKTASGRRFQNVALAVCYACCGYMAYNYQIIKWMIFPVIFPLFCLALLRLLREKKGGWYAVLLAWQLMLSIQLGFMTLLFSLFAGAIWLYTCERKENRTRKMGCMGIDTLVGICISAAVLLPSAILLLQSARSGENLSYFGVMKRHGLDDLFERLFQIANPVLLGLLFASGCFRKRKRRSAAEQETHSAAERFWLYLTGFLWLTVLLEPANLLWHMGSYVCFPVRYGYMAVLSMAALVAVRKERDADDFHTENVCKHPAGLRLRCVLLLVASAVSALGAVCLTLIWEKRLVQAFSSLAISKVCPKETAVTAVVLLLVGVSAWCGQKVLHAKTSGGKTGGAGFPGMAVLGTLVGGFCVYTMILLPPDYAVRQENEAAYRQMTEIAKQAENENAASAELSWLLAREADRDDLPINAALVDRKGSISGYFPTESKQTKAVLESLGYLAPWVSVRAVGGTEISDTMLRNVFVFSKEALGQSGSGSVLCNQRAWAELLSAEDVETKHRQASEEEQSVDVTTGSKEYTNIMEVFPAQELVLEDGTLCISVTDKQLLYLDAGRSADEIFVSVNGEPVEIPEKNQMASAHRLIWLGTFEAQEVMISVTDRMGTLVAAQEMELGALHENAWQAALQSGTARILQPSECSISERNAQIHVSVSAAEGETLFVPFVAIDGWKCIQNGKAVDIEPILGGFLGITLTEGENEVVFSFEEPGLKAGVGISILGFAFLLILFFARRKAEAGWKIAAEQKGKAEKCFGMLYRLLLAVFFAGIYVVPTIGMVVSLTGKIVMKFFG